MYAPVPANTLIFQRFDAFLRKDLPAGYHRDGGYEQIFSAKKISDSMKPLLRAPTRDANDADHLSIILLLGAIYLLAVGKVPIDFTSPWLLVITLSLITAPSLWMRLPYAKWGGVAVSLVLGYLFVVPLTTQGISIRQGFTAVGICAMCYWFFKIDYSHTFPDEE